MARSDFQEILKSSVHGLWQLVMGSVKGGAMGLLKKLRLSLGQMGHKMA